MCSLAPPWDSEARNQAQLCTKSLLSGKKCSVLMEVCLPSRWQESPQCPTTPAQRSSGLSRSKPSVDKEPQTVWYEDAAMTFVGHVYVAVVGNCEHLMLLFYFIVFSMIFMTTSFICYLFFPAANPFLQSVYRYMTSKLLQLPDKHSVTALLNTWAQSIRQACLSAA